MSSTEGEVANITAVGEKPVTEVAAAEKPSKPVKEKKAKTPKVPKDKKPKSEKASAPSHPPYFQMIKEALIALKEKGGSSPYAIAKYVEEKHKAVLPANFKKMLGLQLKKGALKGKLVKVKASYKLSEAGKKEKKEKRVSKAAPKPATGKKKEVAPEKKQKKGSKPAPKPTIEKKKEVATKTKPPAKASKSKAAPAAKPKPIKVAKPKAASVPKPKAAAAAPKAKIAKKVKKAVPAKPKQLKSIKAPVAKKARKSGAA